jgi:hypothetical protein
MAKWFFDPKVWAFEMRDGVLFGGEMILWKTTDGRFYIHELNSDGPAHPISEDASSLPNDIWF